MDPEPSTTPTEASTSTGGGPSTSSGDRHRPSTALLVLLAALAVGGIVSGALQLAAYARSAETARSTEIAGCRATYRVHLIDAPTYRALKAFSNDDRPALEKALDEGDPDLYEDLISLSNTDPDAFLRACHRAGP